MTRVIAHRGAHSRARENTLAAFAAALDLGVDGVELDVRRTRDGVLVVHHDSRVGRAVIARALARDLPAFVPTLHDALVLLAGVTVNVEVKNSLDPREPSYDDSDQLVREVIDDVNAVARTGSVFLSCFDLATCVRARAVDASMTVAWLVDSLPLEDALQRARERELHAVNPRVSLVSERTRVLAGEWGLDLNVWTVNRRRDLAAMVALDVASVITDRPAQALALMDRDAS